MERFDVLTYVRMFSCAIVSVQCYRSLWWTSMDSSWPWLALYISGSSGRWGMLHLLTRVYHVCFRPYSPPVVTSRHPLFARLPWLRT